jgi:hypothetical protein
MKKILPRLALLAALMTAASCGGDSATAVVPPRYLAVAGTYQVTGLFDAFTQAQAQLSGTVTLAQVSRDDVNLTGTSNVVARIGTSVSTIAGLYAATIGDGGIVTFYVGTPGTTTWKFTGTASGNVITGTHRLADATSSYSGSFTAVR